MTNNENPSVAELPENKNTADRKFAQEKFFMVYGFGLLLLLTVFGSSFSKFHLIGPLYLHDLLLVTGAGISLLIMPRDFPYWPVLLLILISLAYLLFSFFYYSVGYAIIIRQFALFGYLASYYLLNRANPVNHWKTIERFAIIISFVAVTLQVLYVLYLAVFRDFDPFAAHNHYWYSHTVIMALILSGAVVLLYIRSVPLRVLLILLILLLCWTTGHASSILSLLVVAGAFIFLQLRSWKKLIPIMGGVGVIVLLMNVSPQFKDKNSDWRILTWRYLVGELITDYHGVSGKGFGAPYFSTELEKYLFDQISSTAIQERQKPDEPYLTAPHNSFISIFFHVGILPGLLILVPFIFVLRDIRKSLIEIPRVRALFMLTLLGVTVWASFNVVLELPHSSGFFWFVYFTYWGLAIPRGPKGLHVVQRHELKNNGD